MRPSYIQDSFNTLLCDNPVRLLFVDGIYSIILPTDKSAVVNLRSTRYHKTLNIEHLKPEAKVTKLPKLPMIEEINEYASLEEVDYV